MICAECVARARQGKAATRTPGFAGLVAAAGGGLLLAWLIFYYLGMMLARIPSDFFGGTT